METKNLTTDLLATLFAFAASITLFILSFHTYGMYPESGSLFLRIVAAMILISAIEECFKLDFNVTEKEVEEASRKPEAKPKKRRKPKAAKPEETLSLFPELPFEEKPAPEVVEDSQEPEQPAKPEETEEPAPELQTETPSEPLSAQEQFNALCAGVLQQTEETTDCGTWGLAYHYGVCEKSLPTGWKDFLMQHGFTLHHERNNKMQDIFLTSDSLLCKVTCVRGYINVMFIDSPEALNELRAKTMELLNRIYSNPLKEDK